MRDVIDSVEQLRSAILALAAAQAEESKRALREFQASTKANLSSLETMAERTISRLTGKA